MAIAKPSLLLKRLLQEGGERPWLEFKENNVDPDVIGRTASACANAAMLAEKHMLPLFRQDPFLCAHWPG